MSSQPLTLSEALHQLVSSGLLNASAQQLAMSVARLDRTYHKLARSTFVSTPARSVDEIGETSPYDTPSHQLMGGAESMIFREPNAQLRAQQRCFEGSGLVGLLAALAHAALKMGHTRLPLTQEGFGAVFAADALDAQQERSDLDRSRDSHFTKGSSQGRAPRRERSTLDEPRDDVLSLTEQAHQWLWSGLSEALSSGRLQSASGGLMQLHTSTEPPTLPPPQEAARRPLLLSLTNQAPPWVSLDRSWVAEREIHTFIQDANQLDQPLFMLEGEATTSAKAHIKERLRLRGRTSYFAQADERSRFAAFAALTHPISLVHGGPGTGKTTLAQRLLAILLEVQAQLKLPQLRVAITAPTGKAAVRVREAIYQLEKTFYPLDEHTKARLKEMNIAGTTLHNLLHFHPDRPHKLHFTANKPLPYDVLIIDEASMLDLPLARALLKALPTDWGRSQERPVQRLIFLGDPDQLPPVGEGALWRDLCRDGSTGVARPLKQGETITLTGSAQALFDELLEGAPPPTISTNRLSAYSAELTVNHRLTKNASKTNTQVDTQTPTQALSQALSVSNAEVLNTLFEHIKQGRTNEAIELIKTSSHHDKAAPISWIRLRHFKGLPEAQRAAKRALSSIFIDPKNDELFKEWHQARREANRSLRAEIVKLHLASHEEERDQLFQHIEAFFKKELILCAQYKGPLGVEHMNELFKKSKPLEGADQAQYIAHPLLILKNHSKTRLYNGDIGFLCEPRTSPDMSTPVSAQVYFEDLSDERSKMRAIPLSRLPAYDHVYAMSVHKSQGSEFREVTISLPAFPSPLLTRELFYTAITRTKTKVRLIASEEALKQAIESLTWRFTLGVSSSIGVESP